MYMQWLTPSYGYQCICKMKTPYLETIKEQLRFIDRELDDINAWVIMNGLENDPEVEASMLEIHYTLKDKIAYELNKLKLKQ